MEDSKDPETDHLYLLFKLFGSASQITEMAEMYRRGGFGYGEVKKQLADAAEHFFAEARARRQEFANRPDTVRDILADGARRAREQARKVLSRVEDACGISGPFKANGQ
jgi:tryptophanyl-tRNA synthetase